MIKNITAPKPLDLQSVDSFDLVDIVDIRQVIVNEQLPKEERIVDFFNQIKNPYLCRCGKITVQSVFSDTEKTFTDCLKQYFDIFHTDLKGD